MRLVYRDNTNSHIKSERRKNGRSDCRIKRNRPKSKRNRAGLFGIHPSHGQGKKREKYDTFLREISRRCRFKITHGKLDKKHGKAHATFRTRDGFKDLF